MRPFAAAWLWLALCASALAQTTAVIEGPTEKPAGALVMLKADKSQASRLYWVLANGPGESFASVEAGKICFFSWHVPGEYKFILIAITPNAPQGQEVAVAEKTVKLTGPAPPVVPPGPTPNPPPGPSQPPTPGPNQKATAAIYVYEKSQTAIPRAVAAAISKINVERSSQGFVGSIIEQDVTTGTGQQPAFAKAAIEAAKKEGLPALVILNGNEVVRIVKNPQTEQQVTEAIP